MSSVRVVPPSPPSPSPSVAEAEGGGGRRRRRRQRRRQSSSPSFLLAWLLALALLSDRLRPCESQNRAALSLGSRLKNIGRKSRKATTSTTKAGDDYAEGEFSDGETSDGEWTRRRLWRRLRYFLNRLRRRLSEGLSEASSDEAVFLSLAIVLVGSFAFVGTFGKSDDDGGDGDDGEEVYVDDTKVDTTFANRGVEIGFEGITMTVKAKKRKQNDRIILDGRIRGKAVPGRMLAIMGPSGSGKSTLIHALAGRLKQSKRLTLSGMRYINGEPITGDSEIPSAFIEQDVNFFPHMTVKETLDFRVELKLGKKLGKKARDDVVADLMDKLSLSKSAHTIVGNTKIRGISGGERKRLSIACEMINSPPVIFLDEPTSGLDSYQATQVVRTLRKLADSGKTIIAVIHQPSQHAFELFDDLLLLSEGKQMYFGPRDKVRSYLDNLGYQASREMGTAEHVLDCISHVGGNGGSDKEEQESIDRIHCLAEESQKHVSDIVLQTTSPAKESSGGKRKHLKLKHILTKSHGRPSANVVRQFKLLLGRALHETFRGKGAIFIKIVQQVTLGLIYGGIYHLGNNQASIQDRFGLLSLIAIGTANMAMASTIRSFPKEKSIVASEMTAKMYATFPYFVAKAISEIPLIAVFASIFGGIIYPLTGLREGGFGTFFALTTLHSIASEAAGLLVGAVSSTSDVALALFPPVIVLNIIFDGKNISEENTPRLLRWIPKAGLIRWGFEGLAINEFEGLTFESGGPRRGPVAKTGADALERFGLTGRTVRDVVRAQTTIISVCWFLSYLGLSLTRQKYMVMKKPERF